MRVLSAVCERDELALPHGLLHDIAQAMAKRGAMDPIVCSDVYDERLAQSRTRRRADGAYYTPFHLVDFIVEHTVGVLLQDATVEDALTLRIIDPACGGGIFLVAALDRIARHCRERGAASPNMRAAIAHQCLYGADIDPSAVALCRLALALAVADDHPASTDAPRALLADNIRCADSLCAPDAGDNGRFHAVIGNPPWGQKGFRFPADKAAYLRRRYHAATGVLDPFKLFVERGHELLRPGGLWGFVLPDLILLKDQQPIRDIILARSRIRWIVDVGRAFTGVNLDAIILVGERPIQPACNSEGQPEGNPEGPDSPDSPDNNDAERPEAKIHTHDANPVSIWHSLPPAWRIDPPPLKTLPQGVFTALDDHRFNIHLTADSLALLQRCRPLPRLGDFLEAHEGVHSGNIRAKLFLREPSGPSCAPLIIGRSEIRRYSLTWGGAWLDLRPEIIDRAAGEYASLGRPAWHVQPKIVVRRTGDRLVAAYDDRGYVCSNNLFVVVPRNPMEPAEMHAYVALLNSAFMTWYFRAVQPRTGRLFAELKIRHLAAFPRPPEPIWRSSVPELGALAAKIAERAGGGAPTWGDLQARVDALVSACFDLGPGEQRMVRAGAENSTGSAS